MAPNSRAQRARPVRCSPNGLSSEPLNTVPLLRCAAILLRRHRSARECSRSVLGYSVQWGVAVFLHHHWGNVCPARYLCIKYPGSSPKFILTEGSPPSRPQTLTAKHVWATSPPPSRGSPIEGGPNQKWLHHPRLLGGRLFGGGKNRHGWGLVKQKMPGACPAH